MNLKVIQDRPKKSTSKIQNVIAVAAGKGGVGKSTVAVNLAYSLKSQGYKVGLLDADVYGPSMVQMLPTQMEPVEEGDKMLPALCEGISYISVAHFRKKAQIVRAPIANQIIEQFLEVIDWGDLDYLIIDFPPGTGDIQLTLMQKGQISGSVVVTTPQIVSTLDVRKAIELFQQMEIPVLGVIENMSYFFDGKEKKLPFGKGGGEELSKAYSIPLLAKLPLSELISKASDEGVSLFEMAKDSIEAKLFLDVAEKITLNVNKLEQFECRFFQKDTQNLEIQFENTSKFLSASEIQSHCPCARCLKEKNVDPNVSFLEISPVGRYAIRFTFSSGCSRGIYPLKIF